MFLSGLPVAQASVSLPGRGTVMGNFVIDTGTRMPLLFNGIIGGGILRRCKVIFDYSRKQLIIEPLNTTPRTFEYDMIGLFLVAKGADFKEFTVISVMDGSACASLLGTARSTPSSKYRWAAALPNPWPT